MNEFSDICVGQDVHKDILVRRQLGTFLLRHGRVYHEPRTKWIQACYRWRTDGTPTPCRQASSLPHTGQRGFTLLELMVTFAIAALVIGVAIPFGARLYDTMQYRDAVREVSAAATAARYKAITKGQAMDLLLNPDERRFAVHPVGDEFDQDAMGLLGGAIRLEVVSAREVSPGDGIAAIRFYPQGGSTGGSVSVVRDNGTGVRLRVDWLLGRVTQESLEP